MCVCVTLHVKVENNFANTIFYVRVCVTPHVKVENNFANTIIYVRVCDTSRENRK